MIKVREFDRIIETNCIRLYEEKVIRRGGKTYRLLLRPEDGLASPNMVMIENHNPFTFNHNLYIGNLDAATIDEMMNDAADGLLDVSHLKETAIEVKSPADIPKTGVYYQYIEFNHIRKSSQVLMLPDEEFFEFYEKTDAPTFVPDRSDFYDNYSEEEEWEEEEVEEE